MRQLDVSDEEALLHYNLAPLCARRDLAMLGLIHRAVLGQGPPLFRKYFRLSSDVPMRVTRASLSRHSKQLVDICSGDCLEILRRSAFGLVRIYNELPAKAVDASSVKVFQRTLQEALEEAASMSAAGWPLICAPIARKKERRARLGPEGHVTVHYYGI